MSQPARFLKVLRCLGVALVLAGCATVPSAPTAVQATSEMTTSGSVGDPRTRAKLHTELASLYFQDNNITVALEELQIAIQADATYAPAYNVLGLIHFFMREIDPAARAFEQAHRLAEGDPEINNNYGWFLCQTGNPKRAIELFARAIRNPLYQTPERAFFNAGQCHFQTGDLVAAEDNLRKSIRLSARNPQALFLLAKITYGQGKLAESRSHLQEAMRLAEPGPEVLALAIRLHEQAGDHEAVAGFAARLRSRFPESPEYKEYLKGAGNDR